MGRTRRSLAVVLVAATTATVSVVVAVGQPVTATAETSRFVPVTPSRVLDTRDGTGVSAGSRSPGSTITLRLAGANGVPADATAVVLNVTSTQAPRAGFIQAYPSGVGTPGASSNLNVPGPNVTIANTVIVPVGNGGNVEFLLHAGGHLLGDLFGYFVPAESSTSGRYQGLDAPTRILDTRDPLQVPIENPGNVVNCSSFNTWAAANAWFWTHRRHGDPANLDGDGDGVPCESLPGNPGRVVVPPDLFKISAGGTHRLPVRLDATPEGGVVPPNAAAVVVNVTATQANTNGFLQLYASPSGATRGAHSNLNYQAGGVAPNLAIVPIGNDGAIILHSPQAVHAVVDVIGYFTGPDATDSTGGLFVPLTPERVRDTRNLGGSLNPQTTQNFNIANAAGLTANEIAAVFVNATIVQSRGPGYLQLFPTGQGTAGASSNVNVSGPGQTRPNAAVTGLANGQMMIYHFAGGHYILDLAGYFTSGAG